MVEEKKEQETAVVEVPEKLQPFVKMIEEMTVIEMADLVKVLEKKFGVSSQPAMGMMPMMAAGAAGAAPAAAAEEKTTFEVVLKEAGAQKIQVIKEIRTVTTLGLKEAKDLVEGAPKTVKEGVTKDEAEKIKTLLEKAGAKVEIK